MMEKKMEIPSETLSTLLLNSLPNKHFTNIRKKIVAVKKVKCSNLVTICQGSSGKKFSNKYSPLTKI